MPPVQRLARAYHRSIATVVWTVAASVTLLASLAPALWRPGRLPATRDGDAPVALAAD